MTEPVFVVNTGRCGSTLLARMLHENPRWLVLSEYLSYLSCRALTRRTLDGETYWHLLSTQSPVLREMHLAGQKQPEVLYEPGRHGPWPLHEAPSIMLATLPFLSSDPLPLFHRLEAAIRPRPKTPLSEHMRVVFATLADATGRTVWIERTGDSLLLVGRLRQLFPNARFLHLHRDGRDVAVSMQGKPDFRAKVSYHSQLTALGVAPYRRDRAYGAWRFHEWVEEIGSRVLDVRQFTDARVSLEACGRHWRRSVEAGLAELDALPPSQVLTVTYEALSEKTRDTLATIETFLTGDTSAPSAWIERAVCHSGPAVRHWPDLPERDRAQLDAVCRPALERLGYR
ncbi:MAG: sulfotransferase [Pseudomonadota bacterium]